MRKVMLQFTCHHQGDNGYISPQNTFSYNSIHIHSNPQSGGVSYSFVNTPITVYAIYQSECPIIFLPSQAFSVLYCKK